MLRVPTDAVSDRLPSRSCESGRGRPYVFLDSDGPGKSQRKALEAGVYKGQEDRILAAGDFANLADNAELEDLIPHAFFCRVVGRFLSRPSGAEVEFEDEVKPSEPIIGQIEQYVQTHGIELEAGWKVQLAKRIKGALLKPNGPDPFDGETETWVRLFGAIQKP